MIVLVRMVAWLLGVLPLRWAMTIGAVAGRCVGAVMRKRTRLAGEALRLGFPEKTPEEIRRILRDLYEHFGYRVIGRALTGDGELETWTMFRQD